MAGWLLRLNLETAAYSNVRGSLSSYLQSIPPAGVPSCASAQRLINAATDDTERDMRVESLPRLARLGPFHKWLSLHTGIGSCRSTTANDAVTAASDVVVIRPRIPHDRCHGGEICKKTQ